VAARSLRSRAAGPKRGTRPRQAPSLPRGSRPWDCVVVGAGPAGLSAAIYMGRFRRRTLVVDNGDGRWAYGQVNQNYLGFPAGVGARRLHRLGTEQARRFGVCFRAARVTQVVAEAEAFRLRADGRTLRARTVIWASGVQDHWPDFPGARGLVGRRLFWCIVCDGWRTFDRPLLLLGQDDQAASTALKFLVYTSDITVLVDPARARLSSKARRKLIDQGLKVLPGRIARVRVPPGGCLQVRLEDGRRLRPAYLFSLLGHAPRTEPLRDLGVGLGRLGHVRVNEKCQTARLRFFAAGDVTDHHAHQVVCAAHEGATAAMAANHALYPPSQKLKK
jgi:thioredoxin reductase (NADPH)